MATEAGLKELGEATARAQYGIPIRLWPGNPARPVRLWRSPDGVSGWEVVAYLRSVPGTGGVWIDMFARASSASYYYRAQHVGRGVLDGTFTPVVGPFSSRNLAFFDPFGLPQVHHDYTVEGEIYKRTTAAEKAGAGRAAAAIGENLEILTTPGLDAAWLEDFDRDTRGRLAVFNGTLSEPAASYTTLTSTTADPQIYIDQATSKLEPFAGGTYQYAAVRYRYSGPPDNLEVFYQRAGVHDESSAFRKTHPLHNDGLWHTELLDMHDLTAGGSDWADGVISRVRFDFLSATGRSIDIDFIAFCTKRIGASRLLAALYEDGSLVEHVQQTEAGQKRQLVKGRQRFPGKRSEDMIVFNPPFQAIPAGRIDPSGAVTQQMDPALWSTPANFSAAKGQIMQTRLLDVTVSSARVWCYLFQRGIVTPRSAPFSGAVLNAAGETDVATVTNAPASPTSRYTIRARTTLSCTPKTATPVTVTIVYAIDSLVDGDADERATVTHSHTFSGAGIPDSMDFDDAVTVDVSGMDGDDQFRLRIISITVSGGGYNAFGAQVVGNTGANNNGQPGVSYATASDIWSNMTPTTDETVDVEVEGYQ